MFNFIKQHRPKISVVVVFYNMRREAVRTLHTLTCNYQIGVNVEDYEVLIMDSNSTEPLDPEWVESLQANFSYHYVESSWPTPCRAMNRGIELAKGDHVVCMIDGARMLSPGVLQKFKLANKLFEHACVKTIAMHLGPKLQNLSILDGYDQLVEDKLLKSVNWKSNGYELFEISSLAESSFRGFTNPISESNCFCVNKRVLSEIGGYNEDFRSIGGGLVNHDTLNKVLQYEGMMSINLMGEASFHQFHGGVATNVSPDNHPREIFLNEYLTIRGEEFCPNNAAPFIFGDCPEVARQYIDLLPPQ